MADESAEAEGNKPKSGRRAILIGLPLALIGGGGGFFAAYSGMLPMGGGENDTASQVPVDEDPIEFVPLDPMIVSIGGANSRRHLRFQAQLEVPPDRLASVQNVLPRVVDVLNGYLRAVDIALLEDPTALVRLRAQMLRRIQIITGEGAVQDLLIMEFVLS